LYSAASANPGQGVFHFRFARGFATSRAQSMKRCAVGLSVRFFRVMIPTGVRACCSLTGKTLSSGRLVENRTTDGEPRAIEVARARALVAGYRNIEFVVASDNAFPDRPLFDAAIGRYILHHLADPVATVRRAAEAVRPSGVVAFQEPASHINDQTLPTIDLYAKSEQRLKAVIRAMLPHFDVGGRLVACFEGAGLPTPHLICEALAGGPASPLWRVFAMAYRSMLPHMVRLNLAPADDEDSDTLADRLVAAAAAMRAQIIAKPQSCAWAIRP
jgi:SAM-dependent methyltransferase